jgi:hypothetical protein
MMIINEELLIVLQSIKNIYGLYPYKREILE